MNNLRLGELISRFLPEYMELFEGEIGTKIRRSSIKLHVKQLNCKESAIKIPFIVVECSFYRKKSFILLGIYSEPSISSSFDESLLRYCLSWYQQHRRQLLPVILFTQIKKQMQPVYELKYEKQRIVSFTYRAIFLSSDEGHTGIFKGNPLELALTSFNNRSKADYKLFRMHFLKLLFQCRLAEQDKEFLASLVELQAYSTPENEKLFLYELKINYPRVGLKLMEAISRWRQEGLEQGRAEGIQYGLERGRIEGQIDILRILLKNGIQWRMISQHTGLEREDLERITGTSLE